MKYVVRARRSEAQHLRRLYRRPSEEIEKAEGCHFRDHGGSSLNYAGIFTCVLLFVILPLAACLHECYIRRHTYTETSDASIQHRLLPRDPDLQCPRIMREGCSRARLPIPKIGRVA